MKFASSFLCVFLHHQMRKKKPWTYSWESRFECLFITLHLGFQLESFYISLKLQQPYNALEDALVNFMWNNYNKILVVFDMFLVKFLNCLMLVA